jgi:hypothetical protein
MLFLMLGIFSTALFTSAIAVYVFRDVAQDNIGHRTEAFAGLCVESVLFTLVVGGPVWLLTLLGRRLFHLRDYSPRAMLGLFLGIGLTMFQYPWEFAARKLFPKLAESALSFYLMVAIVLCTVVLLRDNFRQMNLRKSLETELN